MAESNVVQGYIGITDRRGSGNVVQHVSPDVTDIVLQRSSTVRIPGSPDRVARYERQGDDLSLHMQDGTVVRYQRIFLIDAEGYHSELVFDDGTRLTHIHFSSAPGDAAALSAGETITLIPEYDVVTEMSSLLLHSASTSGLSVATIGGILVAVALGGGVIAAVASNSNDDDRPSTPPSSSLTVNPLSNDNILNREEFSQSQVLSGSTRDVTPGTVVTIVFNGLTYTTLVAQDGTWTITLPASVFARLEDGTYPIQVSVTDAQGSTHQQTVALGIDTLPPFLTENMLTGDNYLNAAEQAQGQTLSGRGEAGLTVTVTLNGKTYTTTVDNEGKWQLPLSGADLQALNEGANTVTIVTVDKAGNSTSLTRDLIVDTTPPPLTVQKLTGDDFLTADELKSTQTLSGITSHNEAGQSVTVTLNGKTYSGIVNSDGSWGIPLSATDLQALNDGTYPLVASITEKAGNTTTLPAQTITVNRAVEAININTLSGDDRLNAVEAAQPLLISGTTANVAEGQTVTVTFNGHVYTTLTTSNGSWSFSVPSSDLVFSTDSSYDVSASVAGLSGPTTHVEAGRTVTLTLHGKTYFAVVESGGTWHVTVSSADMALLPSGPLNITASVSNQSGYSTSANKAIEVDAAGNAIAINIIASDDLINKAEAAQPLAISGNTANVTEGQTVTITLNGKSYTTQVQVSGAWTLQIPSADLQALSDGNTTVTATVSDSQGQTASDQHNVGVHIHAVPAPTINTPFGNGSLNLNATHSDQTVSGKTGISGNGQTVVVTLGGKSLQRHGGYQRQLACHPPRRRSATATGRQYPPSGYHDGYRWQSRNGQLQQLG